MSILHISTHNSYILFYLLLQTADILSEKTYPNIPATRYSLLYTYFIFLQQCVDEGATVTVSSGNDYY